MAFPVSNTILDNFDRANGLIGSNWSLAHSYAGSALMVINTNQAAPTNDYVIMYWNPNTFGPNIEAYVTLPVQTTVSNDGPGLYARLVQVGTGTLDGYELSFENSGHSWNIFRIDNGVATKLGVTVDANTSNGDKGGLEIIGSTIKGYKYSGGSWTEVLSRSDTAHSAAGYFGLYGGADDANYRLDDFGGATLAGSASVSPSASLSPSASNSPSLSPSQSQSPSASLSPSVSGSASLSPSGSQSPSPSESASLSPSSSFSISPSASLSPSHSPSASVSPSLSISPSPSYPQPDFPTVGIVDNFDRADNDDLGSNWNPYANSLKIASQQAVASVAEVNTEQWNAATYGPAVEYAYTVGNLQAGGGAGSAYLYYSLKDANSRYVLWLNSATQTSCVVSIYKYSSTGNKTIILGNKSYSTRTSIKIGVRHRTNGDITLYADVGNGWEQIGWANDNEVLANSTFRISLYDTTLPLITIDDVYAGTYIAASLSPSASESPSVSPSESLSPSASGSPSLSPSASASPSTPPGFVFWIDHETGDDSQYSVHDDTAISVTSGAALAGTNYGLDCNVTDNTHHYWRKIIASNSSGKLRLRFYVDPNSISMSAGAVITLMEWHSDPSNATLGQVRVVYASSSYQISCNLMNDAGASTWTSNYALPTPNDGPHYIEVYWTKASTADANDGTMTLWIDGTQKEAITNIDCYTRWQGYAMFEFGHFIKSGTITGHLYEDEWVANDTGDEIGPLAVPSSSVSPSLSPSASLSPSSSESPSLSPSSSESPSLSPSASSSPSSAPPIEGSVCWGHVTGVLEQNTRTFDINWTGTGTIENSGDTERLVLNSGEYMESEVVNTGTRSMLILINNYASGDSVLISYRHGTTEEECRAQMFTDYTVPFQSLGYVQVRVDSTL